MYGNMTREEMIQRLYDGNFTTGELERQLIAKLFEQCCEGGGSGSSGGGAFVVHGSIDDKTDYMTLDKTAVEIFEAFKTMPVIIVANSADESNGGSTYWDQFLITRVIIDENGYKFVHNLSVKFFAANDNDYPTNQEPSGSADHTAD